MVAISTPANNKKVYFHDGNKLRIGKNKGVPAQTIVNILTDIVLNLGPMLINIYLKFILYRYIC